MVLTSTDFIVTEYIAARLLSEKRGSSWNAVRPGSFPEITGNHNIIIALFCNFPGKKPVIVLVLRKYEWR